MSTMHYRTQKVGNGKMFYREAGRADAPVLLLFHGFATGAVELDGARHEVGRIPMIRSSYPCRMNQRHQRGRFHGSQLVAARPTGFSI